ncbi:hypothetical protein PILCRDRAFT_14367 [Piloderma croceum F 1598]|uniref:Protein kinase domain-containing protein n=1 Tax=Piloderma croceum (strain F 1598) TaxID=765440 RepID=A0A0C3F300_PILCF|nr:hypothetical protein PILCRDRAFT_14367 [Piloderma croceum F 1598]
MFATYIRDLWYHVWWSGWDEDEFASLRMKLLEIRKSLEGSLMALHSVEWVEVADGLRTGHATLKGFHGLLNRRLPFLSHIKLNAVHVVDHLGQNIPVPAMFCSTWKTFDYIIKGYCKDRYGDHHVKWGAYEVIRAEDSQTISPSKFAHSVEPGMVLELSIILRQDETLQDSKDKCPRCHFVNRNAPINRGQFQVAEDDQNCEDIDHVRDEGSNTPGSDGVEGGRGEKGSGKRGAKRNGESDHTVVEDEIISPASNKLSSSNDRFQGDSDCAQFLRRIHIIGMGVRKSLYTDLSNQVKQTENQYFAAGAFSEIYRGEWTNPSTGKIVRVAIKVLRGIDSDPKILEHTIKRLNRETRIWHSLSHKNVVPFLGLCYDFGPFPCMIVPLYDNANVYRYLVDRPDDRLVVILGVAHGLRYLHSKNVIHGNLTGHNVLMDDDNTPLLSDFGRSKFIDYRGIIAFCGSARYMAPELTAPEPDVVYGEDEHGTYENQGNPDLTKETDVFAFSMLALEIWTGKLPFFYLRQDATVIAFVQDGKRPERSRCLPSVFTDSMWALLENCWDHSPERRPSMGSIVERLERM